MVVFFFFQAEDGIRDFHVTGVQTCALPILAPARWERAGSFTETATLGTAASWKTASIPWTARAAAPGSAQSPRITSTSRATAFRLGRTPEEKSSKTRTRCPSRTSASTRWLPMKPAPPVTRTLRARPAPRVRILYSRRKVFAKRVCKPDPVPAVRPFGRATGGDHSSSPAVTRGVKRPTRGLQPGQPRTPPYLVLLRVGFSLPVVSPRRRCALTAPFHPCHPRLPGSSAVCFLWHSP